MRNLQIAAFFIVIFVCVVGRRQKRGGIGKLNIMRILLPTVSKERYVKNAHPTKVRAIKMDRHLNLLAWWTLPCRVSNKKQRVIHIDYEPNDFNGGPDYDAKKADKEIKFCTHCKKCWQIDKETSRESHNRAKKKIIYNYYENFPSIGKAKKICIQCKALLNKRR
tara:strand:- start:736 stop:1230 length:495 start_codon:yes stop_codon:yes gene_type:complete